MQAAPRPCRYPGCGALVASGFCARHRSAVRQEVDARRGSSSQRLYGARWRQARAQFLREHPLCECSECRGRRVTASTVVDHIVPHRGDPLLFWDTTNWQAMAKTCHDRKTAREDGGFGNARSGQALGAVGDRG